MAIYDHIIDRFTGLDQSADETLCPQGSSPDELNMTTDGGSLSVTKGFTRVHSAQIPGDSAYIYGAVFKTESGGVPVAVSEGNIYAYSASAQRWQSVYQYGISAAIRHYSFLQARIGTTDHLLIADGADSIVKFDGQTASAFGSEEGCSNIPCAYLAMYRGRLFAAGDSENANRLYYSQLPGDGRSIEDWGYYAASPAVEGGFIDVGIEGSDPITGIYALSNQIVIFKRYSVYRLIGDRPSNYTVERISGATVNPAATAAAECGDVLYYLTREGLCYVNGVEAAPMPDNERIARFMLGAAIQHARMAAVGQKLYVLLTNNGEKRLVEYDLSKRRYLMFGGFGCYDVFEDGGSLLLINGSRRLCRWGEGTSFDGEKISAYWCTPRTFLGDRAAIKTLREAYLYGSGRAVFESCVGGVSRCCITDVCPEGSEVTELPLMNEGRSVKLRVSNIDGGAFTLSGGLQLSVGVRKRTD